MGPAPLRRTAPIQRTAPLQRTARTAAGWALALLVVALTGALAASQAKLGLALGVAVLAVGILWVDPLLVVAVALPGSLLLQRAGGGGTNLSIADLLVFVAALVSLTQADWTSSRALRAFVRSFAFYEAVLVLVILFHPNRYDIVEWFHRMSDVGGSVLIGWLLATTGRYRQAILLWLTGASVVALIAMEHAVKLHFHPAQWGLYQKNAIGAMMWVAIAVAQLNPSWLSLKRWQARLPQVLCFGGLLASQSRQSIIVLIGVIALAAVLRADAHRRSRLIFVALAPLAVLAYYSFESQFATNPKFNTVAIRIDQLSAALKVWHLSPVLGEGMRFYNLAQFNNVPVPPNVIIGGLASTGVVGVAAFLVFVVWSLGVMARLPRAVGLLGLVVLAGHYVEGLFDIFWIGSYTAIPFVIVGMSLGMADHAAQNHAAQNHAAQNHAARDHAARDPVPRLAVADAGLLGASGSGHGSRGSPAPP